MILENVVQSTISSLGYFEDGVYFREPDCFDSIRDLIRFLHQDDKKTVRRLCTSHNLVKNDLVPIMMSKDVSEELFDAALRLTVNLCQPTLVAFGGKQPEDNEAWKLYYETPGRRNMGLFPANYVAFPTVNYYIQLLSALDKIQSAVKDWESRNERSKLLVERIIVLIRYIFALGTEGKSLAQVTELELRTRERVTHAFLTSSIPEFFVDLVHNSMEREFCLHILNIFALIVQPFKASDVAFAGKAPSAEVINKENQELQKSIEYEREKNNLKRFNLSARNFLGGTYVVSGTKALNQQNELILQK
uniref:Timeless N-terminal domain-containing protein n=1 Tax=Acrobeloides nanus TaxID=290746 RepID=A0A914DGH5_9BILA